MPDNNKMLKEKAVHYLLAAYIVLLGGGTSVSLFLFGKYIQIADLFFLFMLMFIIVRKRRLLNPEFFRSAPSIVYSLVLMLALSLVASIFSANIVKSFIEVGSLAYLMCVYLFIVNRERAELNVVSLLKLWVYVTAGLCVLSLVAFISYTFFGIDNFFVRYFLMVNSEVPIARIKATFFTSSMFISYLQIGIVFLFAIIKYERLRLSYVIIAALILICSFLTASRNLLGIFITIFLASNIIKNRSKRLIVRYISFILIIIITFIVIAGTVWYLFPIQLDYNTNARGFSSILTVNNTPSDYAVIFKVALGFIKDNFLLGLGLGMFNQNMEKLTRSGNAEYVFSAPGFSGGKCFAADPHSTYLGWAAEAGVPFLFIMLGLFYSIMRFLYKGYKSAINSFEEGYFPYLCMCGIIGFLVNGLYIDILTVRSFWFMMGLGTFVAVGLKEKISSS